MAKKNKKKKRKNPLKSIGEGMKNAFNNAKDAVRNALRSGGDFIRSAGLLPLKPYERVMRNKLKKIGKPEGKNLEETTHNFVKYVMGINTFEEWQFENFQNACFTPTIEDLEFAENDEEGIDPGTVLALVALVSKILDFVRDLIKKEPDLDDPENPAPDLPDWEIDPTDLAFLLSFNDEMKQYLAKAGQTYTNDPVANAIKTYQITYPKKQTWEDALGQDMRAFWQNNKADILATIGALFVTIGTNPAPDPISQSIGRQVSSTRTAIEKEAKKQAKLKTHTPLLIIAVVLAIILITKKK